MSEKVFCPRCGNEMNGNSRYCTKCGYLNPNDPANQSMKKYIEADNSNLYQVGSGQTIIKEEGQITTSVASNTGNKKVCFIINYALYMLIIIGGFFITVGNANIDFNTIRNSLFSYIAFITSIVFLYVYSMELIFMKANKRWWYALIPFFNLFILSDIVFKKKWLGIILLIPVIGQLFFIVTLYKLATKFRCSGLFTILFPVIFIPIMGFGSRLYEGIHYADEDKTLENDYKRKRVFFVSIMIFTLIGGMLLYWSNINDIRVKTVKLKNYYYVYATKQIVKKTKQLANENYLVCDDYDYSKNYGVYYIEYADIGEVAYIPLHAYKDVISAYIIIDNTNGNSNYYISMSDGTLGYPETLYNNVNVDSVVSYKEITKRNNINICHNTKQKATVGGLK